MVSEYNKVYFLHIPKTGGRFLTKYILRPMEKGLQDNKIELVQVQENVMQHGGWSSIIDDQTYIISVFREPAEFFVSAVCHMVASQKGLIDEVNWHILKDNDQMLSVSKDNLYEALSKWYYINNFQSQNFILQPTEKSIIQQSTIDRQRDPIIDKSLVYKRVNRTNLMIRHKDLKEMDYSLLVKKISTDLGVDIVIDLSNINKQHFKNHASETLFNSLTQEDKDTINSKFELDNEIYNNDSLFWKPN